LSRIHAIGQASRLSLTLDGRLPARLRQPLLQLVGQSKKALHWECDFDKMRA
jgi:hypothetical protein